MSQLRPEIDLKFLYYYFLYQKSRQNYIFQMFI